MQEFIQTYFGEWGAWVIGALVALVAKDTISQFWSGARFLMGNDFNVDDIVYINGIKRARIVRQSVFRKTSCQTIDYGFLISRNNYPVIRSIILQRKIYKAYKIIFYSNEIQTI